MAEPGFFDDYTRSLREVRKAAEDRMKEIGDVGVPAFVFEDGRVSIDPADAGLVEYGSANACSVEDHKSGRKGC